MSFAPRSPKHPRCTGPTGASQYDLAPRKPVNPHHPPRPRNEHVWLADHPWEEKKYPLTRRERLELLIYRGFIVADKEQPELWPYDDKIVLREGTGP